MNIKKIVSLLASSFLLIYSMTSAGLGVTTRAVLPTDPHNSNTSFDMPRGIVYDNSLLIFYKGLNGKAYYNYASHDTNNNTLSWNATNIKLLADNDSINTKSWLEPAVLNGWLFLLRKNDNEYIRHVYAKNLAEIQANTWEKNEATLYSEKVVHNVTLINIPNYTSSGITEIVLAGLEKRIQNNCGGVFTTRDKVAEKQNLSYDANATSLIKQDDFVRIRRDCFDSVSRSSGAPALVHEDTLSTTSTVHYFLPRIDQVVSYYQLTGENYDSYSDETVLQSVTTTVTPAATFHNDLLYLFFVNESFNKDNQIYFLTCTKVRNELGETLYVWSDPKQLEDRQGNPIIAKSNYGLSAVNLNSDVYLFYADKSNGDKVTLLQLQD